MRAKFTVADEFSRKFSVLYESVVSLAIRCIFMRFSERFRVTLVADQSPAFYIYMYIGQEISQINTEFLNFFTYMQ